MIQNPIYDITKTYEENFEQGPFIKIDEKVNIPELPKEKWIDFLGHKIKSPLGIPAGPLLNSRWISVASKLGFDVLTYKTIRSSFHKGHPLPNMIYIDTKGELNKNRLNETLYQNKNIPEKMDDLSVTNSFGVPSSGPLFLLEDIEKANNSLSEGQIMIVSVMGSHGSGDFIEDYARSAFLAKEAGAKIIEINFSCPNVATGEGSIYNNPDTVYTISSKVVKEVKNIPVIIKVGFFTDYNILEKVMYACAKAGVRAICGINTIGMKVLNENNEPALGKDRITSGVCGSSIRNAGIEFVQKAKEINNKNKFDLEIIGVGGVVLEEHFNDLLNAGAKITMSATGMMWDPFLAKKWKEKNNL